MFQTAYLIRGRRYFFAELAQMVQHRWRPSEARSPGGKNRHSERISEFKSQALRKHYFNNDLWCNGSMTVSKTVGSGSSPDGSAMHEWRNLEDAPDLGSDAEMHVSSVSAPAPVRAKPTSTGRRAPHLVYCSMY